MPFGLNGVPLTFQRLINEVVRDMESFAQAYLDDLVVFSDTWTEHLSYLQTVYTGEITRVWFNSRNA